MKIVKVSKYILWFGYGLTLWKLVLVRDDAKDLPYVIAHEATHVDQWTRIGFFKFPYLYAKELYRVGYIENKYEVEARSRGSLTKNEYKEYENGNI